MTLLDDMVSRCKDVAPLAKGGQKTVLTATHPEHGSVVIKYGQYIHLSQLERITREVTLLREIESPYYPRNYEFLSDQIRHEFLIVEERLDALELSEMRHQFSTDAQIRALLDQLICALNVVWQRRIVHRDIKPANILITPDNEPRIIDLGIARFLSESSLTATFAARGPGTNAYAAPEQLINSKPMINVRTDFFLLGIIVLELMLGFHPFDPEYVNNGKPLVDNIMSVTYVAPPPGRDEKLVGFVTRVLAEKPFDRFRTVEEVAEFLGLDMQSC